MRLKLVLAAMAIVTAAVPIVSYADPAQTGEAVQPAGSDPDQVVCKASPPPIGSRLGGGRECHTQREWDQRAKDAQKELQNKQMHGLQSCIGSCGGG